MRWGKCWSWSEECLQENWIDPQRAAFRAARKSIWTKRGETTGRWLNASSSTGISQDFVEKTNTCWQISHSLYQNKFRKQIIQKIHEINKGCTLHYHNLIENEIFLSKNVNKSLSFNRGFFHRNVYLFIVKHCLDNKTVCHPSTSSKHDNSVARLSAICNTLSYCSSQ